jgi:hypothetical protein
MSVMCGLNRKTKLDDILHEVILFDLIETAS